MADTLKEEKWPQTIRMIVIWCTAILLIITLFFPSEYFSGNVHREIEWGRTILGSKDFNRMIDTANSRYDTVFIKTGVDGTLRDFYTLSAADIASKGGPLFMIASIFRNMAENLNYWFYMLVYRITLNLYWLPFMLVVIAPSVFGGTMRWQSKRHSFGYSSPFLNRRSMHIIGWGIYSVFVSLFVPLSVPPMIGSVILIVLIPVACSLLIANLPKRI